jgi:Flp pilus assembly protein TadG
MTTANPPTHPRHTHLARCAALGTSPMRSRHRRCPVRTARCGHLGRICGHRLRIGTGHLRHSERGSASAQLVVLTPLLILFILFFVGLGRETHARALVNDAAAQAARAATLNYLTPAAATAAANQNSTAALAQSGLSCAHETLTVNTSNDHPGGSISVTLDCQTNLADVVAAGFPGSVTLTDTATAPIDPYVPGPNQFTNTELGGGT